MKRWHSVVLFFCTLLVAAAGLGLPALCTHLQTRALYATAEQQTNDALQLQFTHEDTLAALLRLPTQGVGLYELALQKADTELAYAQMETLHQTLAQWGVVLQPMDEAKKTTLYLLWYGDEMGSSATAHCGEFYAGTGDYLRLVLTQEDGLLLKMEAQGPLYRVQDADALAHTLADFCGAYYGFGRVEVVSAGQLAVSATHTDAALQWHYLLVCTPVGAPQASITLPLYVWQNGWLFNG